MKKMLMMVRIRTVMVRIRTSWRVSENETEDANEKRTENDIEDGNEGESGNESDIHSENDNRSRTKDTGLRIKGEGIKDKG